MVVELTQTKTPEMNLAARIGATETKSRPPGLLLRGRRRFDEDIRVAANSIGEGMKTNPVRVAPVIAIR